MKGVGLRVSSLGCTGGLGPGFRSKCAGCKTEACNAKSRTLHFPVLDVVNDFIAQLLLDLSRVHLVKSFSLRAEVENLASTLVRFFALQPACGPKVPLVFFAGAFPAAPECKLSK